MDLRLRAWACRLLLLALVAGGRPAAAHDETTMSREEGQRLSTRLLDALAAGDRMRQVAAGAASPGELRRRIARLPEVRELAHLRHLSAVVVTRRLADLVGKPGPQDETLACSLAYVLEMSDFRGALPVLLPLVERGEGGCLPGFATQAVKALTRQADQSFDLVFTQSVRQQTVASGQAYLEARARELIRLLSHPGSTAYGADASGVGTLREILDRHAEAQELSFYCAVAGDEIAARFALPADPRRDLELAAFSYVLETGQCRQAVPALVRFLAGLDTQELAFAPQFATRALLALTDQRDPSPEHHTYTPLQRKAVLARARAALARPSSAARPGRPSVPSGEEER